MIARLHALWDWLLTAAIALALLAVMPARADEVDAKGEIPATAWWHRNPDGVTGWTDWHAERFWVLTEVDHYAVLPFGDWVVWQTYEVKYVSRHEFEETWIEAGAEDE